MRVLLPLLAIFLLAAAPQPVVIPDRPEALRFENLSFEVPRAEGHRHQLSNGVPVYIVEDHSLPLVDVALAVRAGDWLDPADHLGRASFAGALLRRGGTGPRTPDAFDEQADFLGAEVNSVGGSTRSGATLNVSSPSFGEALDLFCEMVRAPRFDAGRVEAARSNLRESLGRRTDDPLEVLDREWRRLLYGPDHYTVREVLPRHVDALTPQDLTAFQRATWRPESMVVAVSGDVVAADVLARLEKCFSGWPAPSGAAPSWPPPASSQVPRPGLYTIERDIPQAKMFLGHLATKRRGWSDADEFPLLLMNAILGGDGNRLLRRLRGEMGIAYRCRSVFELGAFEPGAFEIFLETGNASAARALQVTLAEVRRLREEPVPPAELAIVKKLLLDSFPLLFDTPSEVAGRFAEDEYLGRPHDYWRTWRDRVQRVTAEQIQQAAQRYLQPDRMVIVVAGRWDEIQKGAAAAGVKVESLAKGPVTRLPARDPVMLEPAAR